MRRAIGAQHERREDVRSAWTRIAPLSSWWNSSSAVRDSVAGGSNRTAARGRLRDRPPEATTRRYCRQPGGRGGGTGSRHDRGQRGARCNHVRHRRIGIGRRPVCTRATELSRPAGLPRARRLGRLRLPAREFGRHLPESGELHRLPGRCRQSPAAEPGERLLPRRDDVEHDQHRCAEQRLRDQRRRQPRLPQPGSPCTCPTAARSSASRCNACGSIRLPDS